MATVARLRRRPVVLTALLLVIVYIAISLLRGPSGSLSSPATWEPRAIIPNLRSSINAGAQAAFGSGSGSDSSTGGLAAPSPQAAPGFERALPSCRVSDLVDDPLTQEYGQNNIRLSRTYEGSGARIRKVLQKAMRGETIKIAAVGGSVSTGHGVPSPYTSENYMYKRIQQWFLDTFPGAKHELNLDSAIPATTAWYFSYCLSETIPDDADLVLLELDINHHDPFKESLEATEALYRSILSMPKEPALIYISVFGLIFEDMTHGWRHSALISQWLDVPEINIRNFYLPHLMKKPQDVPTLFMNWADDVDPRHMNSNGHRATGDMVIAFLREQLCLLQREGPAQQEPHSAMWPGNHITSDLPRLGMLQKWDETSHIPVLHPKCQSITSTKFPLKPLRADGWESVDRNDKRSYEATVPGSEISFAVNVDAGLLGIYFWMTRDEAFGQAACWVDDDKREERIRRVSGYNPYHWASTFEHSLDMWNDLSQGAHTLTCRLETGQKGGNIFRISATVTR